MSYYCERLNCNCKYRDEKDGCIFYSQGSGNEIDMPCYEVEPTIYDLLYQMSELCKENDINFIIEDGLLFIGWVDYESYSKPLKFTQCFSLFEIKKLYKNIDTVVDEFLSRRDAELEMWKDGSDSK